MIFQRKTPTQGPGLFKNCPGGTKRRFSRFCKNVKRHLCAMLLAVTIMGLFLLGWPRWPWLSRLVDRLTSASEGGGRQ